MADAQNTENAESAGNNGFFPLDEVILLASAGAQIGSFSAITEGVHEALRSDISRLRKFFDSDADLESFLDDVRLLSEDASNITDEINKRINDEINKDR